MFGYSNQQSQCQPRMRAYLAQLLARCIATRKQTRILLDTVSVSKVSKHTNLTCADRRALTVERVNKIAGLQLSYESVVEKFTGVLLFGLRTSLTELIQNRPYCVRSR